MSYAQKDYTQTLGNNGENTIAEAGSLLTAFSNLLEKFGEHVDPAALNAAFVEDGVYLNKDDHVRDRLTWGSVSAYDSTITVVQMGDSDVPALKNIIVRLDYDSQLTGGTVSTFCVVEDIEAKTIIDSYDGLVKPWSVYGQPVAFAVYDRLDAINNTPLKAAAAVPEAAPAVEASTPDMYEVKVALKGFKAVEDFTNPAAAAINVAPGNYFVFDVLDTYVNITAQMGSAGAWIDITDNVIVPPTPEATPVNETKVEQPVTAAAPADDEAVAVPVRIVPADPLKWQKTFTLNLGTVEYEAINDCIVHDLSGAQPDMKLPAGTIVPVAGRFEKDGTAYLRTENSVKEDHWYGVPSTNLRRVDKAGDDELDRLLNSTNDELKKEFSDMSGREKAIAAGATVEGKVKSMFSFGRKQ